MPRPLKGTVRFRKGKWYARVTLEGNDRPTFELTTIHGPDREADARARARLLTDLATRLLKANQVALARAILEKAASRDAKELEDVVRLVDQVCAGRLVSALNGGATFGAVANRWTSGELAIMHPDHVKQKRSASIDVQRLGKH